MHYLIIKHNPGIYIIEQSVSPDTWGSARVVNVLYFSNKINHLMHCTSFTCNNKIIMFLYLNISSCLYCICSQAADNIF